MGVNTVSLYRGCHHQTQTQCLLLEHAVDRHSTQVLMCLNVAPQEQYQRRSHRAIGPGSAV